MNKLINLLFAVFAIVLLTVALAGKAEAWDDTEGNTYTLEDVLTINTNFELCNSDGKPNEGYLVGWDENAQVIYKPCVDVVEEKRELDEWLEKGTI